MSLTQSSVLSPHHFFRPCFRARVGCREFRVGERVRGLRRHGRRLTAALLVVACVACVASGCRRVEQSAGLSVTPKSLRDVPANRLAFRFEPDVKEESLPERLRKDEAEEPLDTIKTDFETRRGNTEALIRTVVDPSGQRALAAYVTIPTA